MRRSTSASCFAGHRSVAPDRRRTSRRPSCSSRASALLGRPVRSSRSPAAAIPAGRTFRSAAGFAELAPPPLDLVQVLPPERAPPLLHLGDELEHGAVQWHRDTVSLSLRDEPAELRLGLGLALAHGEIDPDAGALLERVERAGDGVERPSDAGGGAPLPPQRLRIEAVELAEP